jgi:glycosyltransferase involved in cell wall biosynthesis
VKISIPIICYGGTVHAHYMQGMLGLVNQCAAKGINAQYPLIYFESLISRARNAAAAAALHSKSDYLFFIDTDVVFDPKDFFKLLEADKDICVGLYPKKYISERKLQFLFSKFSQLPSHWRELVGDLSSELNQKKESKIIEVDYSATGFMLIKTDVFKEIAKQKPEIKYKNDIDGYMSYGDNFYDFFRCQVNPDTKKYESEDYGFCKLWQECGGKIHSIPEIKLGHRGSYIFEGSLKEQQKAFL